MKESPSSHFFCRDRMGSGNGFALVTTLVMMSMLVVLIVGMLSMTSIELRSGSDGKQVAEARSNALMALKVAIAELQEEMGPDMRVSAQAAIFDQNANTEEIDGISQPRWLASYEAWGNWLNGSYTNPNTGNVLTIGDTYTPGRSEMFRKWLLSMPEDIPEDQLINVPINLSGWDDTNSVILVGEGSLGAVASSNPEQVTRAYLKQIDESGRSAWWIGAENQKAKINLAKNPRDLSVDDWETSQGDTAEVGVGVLSGFETLDADESLSEKLFTRQSLRPAGIDAELVHESFFDLTASSRGVLASVRTGHLKKDLSLLFEQDKEDLPDAYRFDSNDVREPSIRPMSSEIAGRAVLPERHFSPWTRMRHFYRMYRQEDADGIAYEFPTGTNGNAGLQWEGPKPYTDCNMGNYSSVWDGEDTYKRFPVLSHITYIFSLKTDTTSDPNRFRLRYVASPVIVYWNPYNVEMRLPSSTLSSRTYLQLCQPMRGRFFLGGNLVTDDIMLLFNDEMAKIISEYGDDVNEDIVFKPGEFRIFSARGETLDGAYLFPMPPGFDPQSFGGLPYARGIPNRAFAASERPQFEINFGYKLYHMFNYQHGNTPASFVTYRFWSPEGTPHPRSSIPYNNHVDWMNTSQYHTAVTPPGNPSPWVFDGALLPVGYMQLVIKGIGDHDYDTIGWEQDWRCRNWIQAPPYYLGKGLYMSEEEKIGHTQRIDSPYEFRFGSLLGSGKDVDDIIQHVGRSAIMSLDERVTAVPGIELPTAPIGSLAGFSGMRIDPGWVELETLNPEWKRGFVPRGRDVDLSGRSLYLAQAKATAYQSGITGPGIGNSFLHPMISRTDVYQFLDNSKSMELKNREDSSAGHTETDTKAYCDYWDHVFLLNDALWDDYFVSSLADQTRPGATASDSLEENLQKLANGEELANSRYQRYFEGPAADDVVSELNGADGYLKAAAHLMVDGMFNVNSTSVDAWYAVFAGIRERQVVYRDQNGVLKPVSVPADKRIAVSRFNVATTNLEGNDPEFGITRDDGMQAWSGVRFLDDGQLRKLAEECVKQVKRRGPFLNFSEFINRRLSNDDLGVMGALQSAIDYDDASPEVGSINYDFKSNSDFMLEESDLGNHAFETPQAAVGSRFAGIPGYVIQSDLLKPIANTLSVRDDTFRIRAYGDKLDENGNVIAKAWCEAIVQRVPEYCDSRNNPEVPAREMNAAGEFSSIDNSELTPINRQFGRKFQIQSFRWLSESEI